MKKLSISLIFFFLLINAAIAQEFFTIEKFDVNVSVNKDASLDITETISVNFSSSRHGIFRMIPYQYAVEKLPKGNEQADMQMTSNGRRKTMIENISVDSWKYDVSTEGDYYKIKIGDKNAYVDG